ncbi:glycoside hydrolase family protein [Dysgonomonas macrotermitis]|uniref:Glycosyl Hydrolase Family 88 n=1 Tax=Dysgonomonas macrotermitis TaxID=1346286 RepID=A0A1M4YF36_9BACT|nr:glycoside hydrolase family 88 protein [Dysgonomonas macrotermitis]SHF04349.1 Glycosyl Hydrolase Family 88 [Dysgonomonas macrotermitis]
MSKLKCICISTLVGIMCISCESEKEAFINENINYSVRQTTLMLEKVGKPTGDNYPRTMDDDGNLVTSQMKDWTPGFFPGSLWYLYELTGDTLWRNRAEEWTQSLEPLKTFTEHHDLGFMMYCSYGNANRLAPKPEYKDILIQSSESLSSRFNKNTKTIKSWNYRKAWNDTVEWFYPVIIDNMMNLEMLFNGTELSGNERFKDIAITHANTTLINHFRDDYSSYHVVDYDTITGAVKYQGTCQGYSDNSTWSRGQAWAIYGYTMMYRETKDQAYLDAATKMANWYLDHLPEDLIPLWDFNVNEKGYTAEGKSYAVEFKGENLKDVSAAAITCSALFELGEFTKNKRYLDNAVKMLHTLASPQYRAELGTNANFLLKHSVGSIPHKTEIDKPLVYADYYFLEALVRYKNMK